MAVALLVLLMEKLHLVNVSLCMLLLMDILVTVSIPPAITCPTVPSLNNGNITFGGASPDENGTYAFNVMATYSCDTGFSLIGNTTRNCFGDGSSIIGDFDGSAPLCEGNLLL